MKESIAEVTTKQEVLKDFINFYETNWLEGKYVACNDKHVTDKGKCFLDIPENASDRFHIIDFYKIAEDYVKRKGEKDIHVLQDLAKAFEILELICVNLFLTPWRKEIRSLKTFTGHFMYYVRPVISEDAVKGILEKIGYSLVTATEFRLHGKTDDEISKSTALEMFLARTECEFISEIIKDAKDCQILDILKMRCHAPLKYKDCIRALKEEKEWPMKQATAVFHATSESTEALANLDYNLPATSKIGAFSFGSFGDTLNQHLDTFELTLQHPVCESHDCSQRSKVQESSPRVYHCSTSSDNLDLYNEYPEESNSPNWCFENPFMNELPQEARELRRTDRQAMKQRKKTETTDEDSVLLSKKNKESPHTTTQRLQCDMDVNYTVEETCEVKTNQIRNEARLPEKGVSSNREDRVNHSNVIAESTRYKKVSESSKGSIKYPANGSTCAPSTSSNQLNSSKVADPDLRYTDVATAMDSSAFKSCKPSQHVVSNASCMECSSPKPSAADLGSKNPVMYLDSYNCYESKTVREPPYSLYIPPDSLSHFSNQDNNIGSNSYLTSQPDCKQNYFQKPSDDDSFVKAENCILQVNEDKNAGFMVISKHKPH